MPPRPPTCHPRRGGGAAGPAGRPHDAGLPIEPPGKRFLASLRCSALPVWRQRSSGADPCRP